MATSGTNYTVKWELADGVLTISPVSGSSGVARIEQSGWGSIYLTDYITLTAEEKASVHEIVFVGNISFMYKPMLSDYIKQTDMYAFFRGGSYFNLDFPNLQIIDVNGLNTTGVTDFSRLFSGAFTQIRNLSALNVSSGTSFSSMFSGCLLSALDLSSYPLNNADIKDMISDMDYCETVILPNGFAKTDDGSGSYSFGLAKYRVSATKGSVTVSSDEDFFKLDSAQGGTWTRDISGTASLSFRVLSTSREANIGTINYTYATTSATADIYLKKASESSFPSTASQTITLTGSGSGSADITLPTDDAYDMKIIVSDGTTSIYLYPSVSSNVLLLDISESGDLTAAGTLRAKTEQLAPTISVTKGTTVRYRIIRFGNVVTIYLTVRNPSSVAVGGFVYQAKLGGIPLPPDWVSTATYFGSRSIVAMLSSDGVVYVKNTHSAAFAVSSAESLSFSFTYIVD